MTHLSDYDFEARSQEFGLSCKDESLAVQSQRDEADINTLVKRFGITGQMPQNVRAPTFEDFTEVFDFQSAMHAVMAAQESFMQMPADVRSRFGNDAQEFVRFCSDKDNLEEMRKLGLAIPAAPVVDTPPVV